MIMITLNQIKEHQPCREGWEILLKSKNKTASDDEQFPVSDILDSNGLDDTIWVLRCIPESVMLWRKFAWWCATQVVHLATDPIVQECLDVVWRYTEGEASEEELKTAQDAAYAYARAADADAYADAAAYAYADAAAEAAAYAAAAADAAAYAYADAAAEAAAAQIAKLREILDTGKFTL